MASAYLNKTLGGTGNKDKWTFSCWVKRHNTGVIHPQMLGIIYNLFGIVVMQQQMTDRLFMWMAKD